MWSTVSLTGRQIQASRTTRRRAAYYRRIGSLKLNWNLKRLIHSAISPGSRKTYEQAWNHFLDFSTRYCGTAFPQLPLSVSDIALFVAYLLAKKLAASTISTYISALSYVHKIGSFSDPTKAFVVQKIWLLKASSARNRMYGCLSLALYYINWCWLWATPSRPLITFYYSKQCFSWLFMDFFEWVN